MQIKLKFKLPEEKHESHVAINGGKYLHLLYEITNRFREKSKYSEDQATTWHEAYDMVWEILGEERVDPFTEGE